MAKNPLVDRLTQIDGAAQTWAREVLYEPNRRLVLRARAADMLTELMAIAAELKSTKPDFRSTVGPRVSEAILDLRFVQNESNVTSLRLGRLQQKVERGGV